MYTCPFVCPVYRLITRKRKGTEKKEIRANSHETRDGISLISYAGWLGLSPVISAIIHFLNVRCIVKS